MTSGECEFSWPLMVCDPSYYRILALLAKNTLHRGIINEHYASKISGIRHSQLFWVKIT